LGLIAGGTRAIEASGAATSFRQGVARGEINRLREAFIMRRLRPLTAGLLLAAGHFILSLGIVPMTLKIGSLMPAGAADALFYRCLALVTRVLYFPIISLALYPRHWFPGDWITVPIAVNSLLWGAGLALMLAVGRRLRTRPLS
jgi:hypothetical protein